MKKQSLSPAVLAIVLCLCACQNAKVPLNDAAAAEPAVQAAEKITYSGQVFLYGEAHGEKKILEKELEIWKDFYAKGMRHLFVELPYYTAQFLNVWMREKGNDIFEAVYYDSEVTAFHNEYTYDFYMSIKQQCPETIFHGTDVGHQYESHGERYLKYLADNGRKDSPEYRLTQEVMRQGRVYYSNNADIFRENTMVKNFLREIATVDNEDIMGIYGSAHTLLEGLDFTGHVPCMANQLKTLLGDSIHAKDLSPFAKDIEPLRKDRIKVGQKTYTALYFGKVDISEYTEDYACREFWRLEDAYGDFSTCLTTGELLPYDNYPMLIDTGQVFVIDYTRKDGKHEIQYCRADGDIWNDEYTTVVINEKEKIRKDAIKIGQKTYSALYFGKVDISRWSQAYACREFWRIEDAYDDFSRCAKTDDVLPYNNYPMPVKTGQVFIIDYTRKDGSVERKYYRSDGDVWGECW